MKTISVQCPDELAAALERLAQDGWVSSPSDAIVEALRRFVESHRPELTRQQVLKDVEWGLHGND